MYGVQTRSLTDRELVRHCANKLELAIIKNGLTYEEQVELLRRFVMVLGPEQPSLPVRRNSPDLIDPEAD